MVRWRILQGQAGSREGAVFWESSETAEGIDQGIRGYMI